jgi:NTP pyrophosphatase (non-canonical NTP hydrolase)
MNKTMNELNDLIIKWAEEKGITTNGTPIGQASKTLEETNELMEAVLSKDVDAIKDAIGDIYVTIAIQAYMNNLSIYECISSVYDIISKRTGEMVDGVFVKNEQD